MKRQEKILIVRERLSALYPDSECTLTYKDPFQLLIATQLAAQCTDARVNIVTKTLYEKYPTVESFAAADLTELEQDIKSTGFYHNKAKNIIGCAKKLLSDFGGEVPKTMDELLSLPGTGRKTANLVLGDAFGIPGIVIDTHAKRLAGRIGLTKEETPEKIEKDLMKFTPKDYWTMLGHHFVDHGRAVCDARKPKCENCVLSDICAYAKKNKK
ncbi:MAG: endonuclease III [Clostridia bacterium]|nr:endonuclease III [Clostridia bacterium]